MKFIPNALTKTVSRQLLIAQKNSPRVLFVAGIAGVVTSTVLACRATLKLSDTLTVVEADVQKAKRSVNSKVITVSQYRRELAYSYVKSSYSIVKLYTPAIVVGGLSIAALTSSHVVLTRRNASLTAAYATISKAFEEYRDRVRDEYGEEKELDIYRGFVTEKVVDEKGKTHTVKVLRDPNKCSGYAKIFDEYNPNWKKDPEYNRMFLTAQMNYANHMLQSRGHVFLNEIYESLGFPHTRQGAIVGWVIGPEGDNYIDFNMYNPDNSAFINGQECSIVLDFNVDGVIFDKI